ncbi:expressed protein [Phakopsora pachyrhizi]|uniref:Expressed protein n=1 Tax=Phakopsora pachyrhizi TaxID=170000 RepID=A0AAV0AG98_PHAPC|nr:expressed protein [Phakopsora pachyrhizi]
MYRKSFSSLMFLLYLLCTFSLAASHPKNGSDNAGNRGNGEIVERKYEDYQISTKPFTKAGNAKKNAQKVFAVKPDQFESITKEELKVINFMAKTAVFSEAAFGEAQKKIGNKKDPKFKALDRGRIANKIKIAQSKGKGNKDKSKKKKKDEEISGQKEKDGDKSGQKEKDGDKSGQKEKDGDKSGQKEKGNEKNNSNDLVKREKGEEEKESSYDASKPLDTDDEEILKELKKFVKLNKNIAVDKGNAGSLQLSFLDFDIKPILPNESKGKNKGKAGKGPKSHTASTTTTTADN